MFSGSLQDRMKALHRAEEMLSEEVGHLPSTGMARVQAPAHMVRSTAARGDL